MLAPGQLAGIPLHRSREPDEIEELLGAFRTRLAILFAHAKAEFNVLLRCQVREQAVRLEDHADVSAVGRPVGDVGAVEDDTVGIVVAVAAQVCGVEE